MDVSVPLDPHRRWVGGVVFAVLLSLVFHVVVFRRLYTFHPPGELLVLTQPFLTVLITNGLLATAIYGDIDARVVAVLPRLVFPIAALYLGWIAGVGYLATLPVDS